VKLAKGRLVARMATGEADLGRAQDLRHVAFLAARGLRAPGGRDVDDFDAHCDHVLIEDTATGQLLACFRLQRLAPADIGRSYSALFYDLAALQTFARPVMELGRFCLHPSVQDPEVLRLSWAAITRLVDDHGVGLLFGCSSFMGAEVGLHAEALAFLGQNHRAPAGLNPGRKSADVADFPDRAAKPALGMAGLPPLLRSYLSMGGWVSDHAVIDRAMDTLHVFTGLETAKIPPARAKALRLLAAETPAP
jgi:L-ornithine Nalpha-acyltransferase